MGGITSTSFQSRTPLQDRQVELGIDVIMQCNDTLQLNERSIQLNAERDELRAKRGVRIHDLFQIDKREREIDAEEDAINIRQQQIEHSKKGNVQDMNRITERTKDILQQAVLNNCTINIE